MDTMTSTATKAVTNTKLAIATLAMLAASGIALAVAPLASKPSLPCTDTDTVAGNSINLLTKGTATGIQYVSLKPITVSDSCNAQGKILEQFCNSNGYEAYTTQSCPTGTTCFNGACLAASALATTTLKVTPNYSTSTELIPGNNVLLGSFNFLATNGEIILQNLVFTKATTGTISFTNWKLVSKDGVVLGIGTENTTSGLNKITFQNLNATLSSPTSLEARIYADVVVGSSSSVAGIQITIQSFGDVVAFSKATNKPTVIDNSTFPVLGQSYLYTALPDLIVSDISFTSLTPGTTSTSAQLKLKVTIKNIGAGIADGTKTAAKYLKFTVARAETSLADPAAPFAFNQNQSVLLPGGEVTTYADVYINPNTKQIRVRADWGAGQGYIAESNEDNNVLLKDIPFASLLPDLVVSDISLVSSTPTGLGTFKLKLRVTAKNIGSVIADGTKTPVKYLAFTVEHFKASGVADGSPTPGAFNQIQSVINPGSQVTADSEIYVMPDTKTIKVKIDWLQNQGYITEFDENNNSAEFSIPSVPSTLAVNVKSINSNMLVAGSDVLLGIFTFTPGSEVTPDSEQILKSITLSKGGMNNVGAFTNWKLMTSDGVIRATGVETKNTDSDIVSFSNIGYTLGVSTTHELRLVADVPMGIQGGAVQFIIHSGSDIVAYSSDTNKPVIITGSDFPLMTQLLLAP